MTPAEVASILREKGMCGRVTGDKPHEVACILPIGHDEGEHEDPVRWEYGLRSVVSILLGPAVTFEIRDMVEMVRQLQRVLVAARRAVDLRNGPLDDSLVSLNNAVDAYGALEKAARDASASGAHARSPSASRTFGANAHQAWYASAPKIREGEFCVCGKPRIGWLDGPSGRLLFCLDHEKDAEFVARGMGATIYTLEGGI